MLQLRSSWTSRSIFHISPDKPKVDKLLRENSSANADIIEEYYNMLSEMYDKIFSKFFERSSFNGELPEEETKKKDEFVLKNDIPQFTQALAEYLILVQRYLEKKRPPVPQTSIYTSLLRLEKFLSMKRSSWELVECEKNSALDAICTENSTLLSLSNFELNMLEQTQSQYISQILADNEEQVLFFPATTKPEPDIIVIWRIIEKITRVKLIPDRTLYMHKLEQLTKIRLKQEVHKWIDNHLKDLKFETKEDWMKNAKSLIKALQNVDDQLVKTTDECFMVKAIFDSFCYHYWDSISEAIEEKLLPVCKSAVMTLDRYQEAYKDFHVNLRESCILAHAVFQRTKHIGQRLSDSVERKESCEGLRNIESLFGDSFLNLIHVMENECHKRIRRAIENENKDSFMEEEGIMSSTVIVLNCFCTVIDEWSKLEIDAEDVNMAFLIKVTDILCDGAKIFANELVKRAINMGSGTKDNEFLKKVCFLINSVKRMEEYILELPDSMKWEDKLKYSSQDPNESDYKSQIGRILNLLLDSASTQFENTIRTMMSGMTTRIQCQHSRFLNSWFQIHGPHLLGSQSMEKFLASFDESLGIVNDYMRESEFPLFLRRIWISFLDFTEENFQDGKSPEYAKTIKKNINDLRRYFTEHSIEETLEEQQFLQRVLDMLELNARSTVALQLQYFSYFADLVTSPDEYLGHMAMQAGFKKTGRGVVDVHLKIKKLQRLPLRKFNFTQLNMKLKLAPKVIFPSFRSINTRPLFDIQDSPLLDESFHFKSLPVSVLSVEGSVFQVLVTNQDSSFCCEALLKMSRIQDMNGFTSVEFLPVYLLPLRRMDKQHEIFKILEQRKKKDRQARHFIQQRKRVMGSGSQLLSCAGLAKPLPSLLPAWPRRISGIQQYLTRLSTQN